MATSWSLLALALAAMTSAAIGGETPDFIGSGCKNLSAELGAALGAFDQCALDHSRPFEVCRRCASVYEYAHKLFSDVIDLRSTRSKRCRALIDAGKVSLVKVNFEHINYVWRTRGICDECFNPGSFNLEEPVKEFFTFRDQLLSCMNHTRDSNSTCDSCHPEFRNLTDYFDNVLHVRTAMGHHLCLDMVDAMNQTRSQWGDRCYHPAERPTEAVIFLAAAPCFVTVAFYLLLRAASRPKDTELAEPNTLQTVLQDHNSEYEAATKDRSMDARPEHTLSDDGSC